MAGEILTSASIKMKSTKKKIVAIVQARMGATRLPNKVLMKIGTKTTLQHVIDRLKKSKLIDDIIIATSKKERDKEIVNMAKKFGVNYFVGDELDVLKRFYCAAKKNNADVIIRIPSDEPFIDPSLVDEGIKMHMTHQNDYTSTIINRKLIKGLDFEIFNFKVLEKINLLDQNPSSREHVTAYMISYCQYSSHIYFLVFVFN